MTERRKSYYVGEVRPMTRRERASDAWWDALRWLRCHVLRKHYPVTEFADRRVGRAILFGATGWLICDVCHRRLGESS